MTRRPKGNRPGCPTKDLSTQELVLSAQIILSSEVLNFFFIYNKDQPCSGSVQPNGSPQGEKTVAKGGFLPLVSLNNAPLWLEGWYFEVEKRFSGCVWVLQTLDFSLLPKNQLPFSQNTRLVFIEKFETKGEWKSLLYSKRIPSWLLGRGGVVPAQPKSAEKFRRKWADRYFAFADARRGPEHSGPKHSWALWSILDLSA